jgi:hypothetical protein
MSNIVTERVDRSIVGLLMAMFLAFCVVGCVYIVNSPDRPIPMEPIIVPVCKPIVSPALPPMPAPPVMTERELRDKSLSDDVLVNNIKELREWGRTATTQYQSAIREQLASCK